MDSADSDESLMLRYRDGDAEAFGQLYARHKAPLYRYFLRQCSNRATAEELFQDVWMKLIGARDRYEVKARFTTWLYHMAHNRLVDFYRSHARGIALEFEEEDCPDAGAAIAGTVAVPERQYAGREQAQRLLALVEALPATQREAFLMKEEGGLALEEIAAATGVGRETAKSRLRYAYAALRRGMEDEA
jgi:RNA polymerase sigma-70 factor (ECF subfamily)